MHNPSFRSPSTHRNAAIAALLVSTLILGATRPARADETSARAETANDRVNSALWSTEKKVLIFPTIGVGVAAIGVSLFSFIKSRNAAAGLEEFPGGDCATLSACDRLATLTRDNRVWLDRGVVLTGVGTGLVAASVAMAFLVPNGQTSSVSPSASASSDGASLSLSGRF